MLEINGDYWHANPDKYLSEDVIHYPGGNFIKAKDIWEKDLKKKLLAEKMGFLVVYIWESEISRLKDDKLKIFLVNIVKNEIEKHKAARGKV